MTPRPVVLCILDGWGHASAGACNAVTLAKAPTWQRWMGDGPPRADRRLRTRGRPAGGPDGQFRSGPYEYRRRPGGNAGSAAHRHRDPFRRSCAQSASAGFHRQTEGERRPLPPAGPALARRGAFPPASHGGAGKTDCRGGRAGTGACLPRRARHATAKRTRLSEGLRRRSTRNPTFATVGGPLLRHGPRQALGTSGSGLCQSGGWCRRTGANPRRGCRSRLCPRRNRRIRQADGGCRICRHERWRRAADGEFPRRPGAAIAGGVARSRFHRLCPSPPAGFCRSPGHGRVFDAT